MLSLPESLGDSRKSNPLVSRTGEQISSISNETKKNLCSLSKQKDHQSLLLLMPTTTTTTVISVKFCADWTMETWLKSYCVLLVALFIICVKRMIPHYHSSIYNPLYDAHQYISTLYKFCLNHVCLLIVAIGAHYERKCTLLK